MTADCLLQTELRQLEEGTWDYPTGADFPDQESFNDWRSRRRIDLEDRLETLQEEQSRRSTGPSPRTSISDPSSRQSLVFKPSDSQQHYRELLGRFLDADLDAMANLADTEMVPLGILSESHATLLKHCGQHWSFGDESRAVLFCFLLVDMLKAGDIPVECVQEAIASVMVVEAQTPIRYWLSSDAQMFYASLDDVVNVISGDLSEALRQYYKLRARDIEETTNLLGQIIAYQQENRGSRAVAVTQTVARLKNIVFQAAKEHYRSSTQQHPEQEITGLVHIARWLEKEAKTLDKRYPSGLIEDLDITSIALSSHIPEYFKQLRHAEYSRINAPGRPRPDLQDVFYLYQTANRFQDMLKAFVPHSSDMIDANRLFEPYIYDWFKKMRNDVTQWVDNAIAVDTFEATSPNGPSSSVVDTFESLHHAQKVLNELEWKDERRFGDFVAEMSMIISLVINRYANALLVSFNQEMAFLTNTAEPESPAAMNANLLQMAQKLTLRSEKKVAPPFNFQPSICVKINDAEEAMQHLDRMYWDLDVDRFSQNRPITVVGQRARSVFTIRVVRADLGEDMRADESALRTQVVLSDEKGTCVAQTRVVSDSSFPRCESSPRRHLSVSLIVYLQGKKHSTSPSSPRSG